MYMYIVLCPLLYMYASYSVFISFFPLSLLLEYSSQYLKMAPPLLLVYPLPLVGEDSIRVVLV